jgi:hypothetical protein
MLLVHIRVQGEGEAKLPSFLTYRLILVKPATDREDKAVTEAEPSQLKSQKIPSDTVPSDPTPHCSGVQHIRTSGNEPSGNIRSYQVGIRNVSFGTGVWYIWIPSTHFSIKPQEISRKSHMPWMSLRLQVSQAGRVSLTIDVIF